MNLNLLQIKEKLKELDKSFYLIKNDNNEFELIEGTYSPSKFLCFIPSTSASTLGDNEFKKFHNVDFAYMAGSMAHTISSKEFVVALSKNKILASYGAGGVSLSEIKEAISYIKHNLSLDASYAFNLIHNYHSSETEMKTVELYLQNEIHTIEASAFLDITLPLVYYRISGLDYINNNIIIKNKIIAKISRHEIAQKFMSPAPTKIVQQLLQQNLISEKKARLAEQIPLVDDITVEADSGGHTDNRPLVCILPAIISLRDELQNKFKYRNMIRIGAAGGIGTSEAALAAFTMGASYIVTGSINQQAIEANTSIHVKKLLAESNFADLAMAPSSDMFEIGAKVQVLKRGSMYASRAQKLYEIYKNYGSIEEIPSDEKEKIEQQIFKTDLQSIWNSTEEYFKKNNNDTEQNSKIFNRANQDNKFKMALIFRWYLGQSAKWAINGIQGKEMDYQIWCGPSIGAFNNKIKGTYLEKFENKSAYNIAKFILEETAYLQRVNLLEYYTKYNYYK
ncbi:MAG: PfaD family polyunsaturated fatty acid/polyketide biosynthesis protein [Oligoflexia bacterium]|nr:PfaD family polyunsaturated fatty acid/polyketide biosynthesis protein [Oligoflexia bacterium]